MNIYTDKEATCNLKTFVRCGAVYYMTNPQKNGLRKLENFDLHSVYLRTVVQSSFDGIVTMCFLESHDFGDDVLTYNLFLSEDVHAVGITKPTDYFLPEDVDFKGRLIIGLEEALTYLSQKILDAGAVYDRVAFLEDIRAAFGTCASELFDLED